MLQCFLKCYWFQIMPFIVVMIFVVVVQAFLLIHRCYVYEKLEPTDPKNQHWINFLLLCKRFYHLPIIKITDTNTANSESRLFYQTSRSGCKNRSLNMPSDQWNFCLSNVDSKCSRVQLSITCVIFIFVNISENYIQFFVFLLIKSWNLRQKCCSPNNQKNSEKYYQNNYSKKLGKAFSLV